MYMGKSSVCNEFCVALLGPQVELGAGQRGIGKEERGKGPNVALLPIQLVADYFNFGHRMT